MGQISLGKNAVGVTECCYGYAVGREYLTLLVLKRADCQQGFKAKCVKY